jgi:GntR family transcriptional regulator
MDSLQKGSGVIASTPVPKYHIVKEVMLGRIIDGTWPIETMIPSEPELCHEFNISRMTIRRAIGDLVHEGRLRTVQGKGTFVAKPKLEERFVQRAFGIYDDMERRGFKLTTQVLRLETILASVEVAARLQIQRGDAVHILVRLRSVADEKVLVSTTYIPAYLCPGLIHEDLSTGSLYRLLKERYGLTIARGERSLEAVAAAQWEARLLELALGSPLLRMDSVAYLADRRAFEYSQALHNGQLARVDLEFFPVLDEQ